MKRNKVLVIKKTSRQSCENFKYFLPFQSAFKLEHNTSLLVRLKAIRHLVHSRFSANAQLFRSRYCAPPCLYYFLQYCTSFRSPNISLPQINVFPSFCSFTYLQSICAEIYNNSKWRTGMDVKLWPWSTLNYYPYSNLNGWRKNLKISSQNKKCHGEKLRRESANKTQECYQWTGNFGTTYCYHTWRVFKVWQQITYLKIPRI